MGFLRIESALKAKEAGPPPAFPGNLPGTVLWVASDGTTTLVNDGTDDRLSQWNNGAGGSNHLTQATVAQRPYWVTNQLNTFPVADFRGDASTVFHWMASSASSNAFWTVNSSENAEIWIVFRPETLRAASHLVNINQSTTTNALQIRWTATQLEFAYRTATGLTSVSTALTVNTWYIARLRKAGATVTGYLNGIQVAQATDARAHVLISGGSPIVLGGREDNTNCIDGKILECWIGNQLLSTTDAAVLEEYLHDRYGLLLPRVVASAKNAGNVVGTTGVAVTHGFSLRNNDVLYSFLAQGDDPGTGWASSSGGTWDQIANQATTTNDDRASGVVRRVVTNAAGEPSSYTFTRAGNSATDHIGALVVQVRGAHTTTPEDATPTVAQGSNDFTPPGADITTANANSLILPYHLGVIGTGKTAGAPSGFTLVDSQQSNLASFGIFQEVAWRHQTAAGAVTVGSWTGTPDDSTTEYDVITVAVRQAAAAAPGLLLDTISTAPAGAYSLRKLSAAYAGAAVRIRRTIDNVQQDIGFDANGDFDTAALTTFIDSGTNGYVHTIYDQSGNGRNLVQTTNSRQMHLKIGATISTTANGKPILWNQFAANLYGYPTSVFSTYTGTTATSAWVGVIPRNTAGNDRMASLSKDDNADNNATTRAALGYRVGTGTNLAVFRSSGSIAQIAITTDALYAIGTRFDGSNVTLKHGSASNSAANSGAFDVNQFYMGMESSSVPKFGLEGRFGEWIVWLSDPGTTDWDAVLSNQRTYWGAG